MFCLSSSRLLIQPTSACNKVYFGPQEAQNIACKCDAKTNDCSDQDELTFSWPQDDSQLVQVVSDKAGARFQVRTLESKDFEASEEQHDNHNHNNNERVVEVDVGRRQQQVAGYGGAFTDSASMLLSTLPDKLRESALNSYFGPRGLAYNLARVPVGGTDMSWRAYSCGDTPHLNAASGGAPADDFSLNEFKLQPEDLRYKLPLINHVNAKYLRRPEQLKLMFSSWSAPNWMKSNHSLVQGRLKATPDGRYYSAYARYILKYIEAYEQQLNTSAWALTPQNEPCTPGRLGHQVVNYNSVNFEPHEMGDFLRNHLIPELERHRKPTEKVSLFSWDDTLLGLERYRDLLFHDARVYEFTRGLAVHWYSQGLDKLPYKSLFQVRRWLPNKFSLISTEASFIGRPRPGDWSRAVKYARDIIENLRAGAIGWIDWNLALNMAGGPTWSGNYLDAAILVDEHEQSFYKNPMFYAIGHLSRFMRAGSSVLASQVYRSCPGCERQLNTTSTRVVWKMVDEDEEQTSALLAVAGELSAGEQQDQPGGRFWRQISVVLLNRSPERLKTRLQLTNCRSRLGQKALQIELNPNSITSLALNC